MKIAGQAVMHGVDLTWLSFTLDQLNRISKYFEFLTEEETAGAEPLTHDRQSGRALPRCAHCYERQTEWLLHRPSL